jgi:hypothetical protein
LAPLTAEEPIAFAEVHIELAQLLHIHLESAVPGAEPGSAHPDRLTTLRGQVAGAEMRTMERFLERAAVPTTERSSAK